MKSIYTFWWVVPLLWSAPGAQSLQIFDETGTTQITGDTVFIIWEPEGIQDYVEIDYTPVLYNASGSDLVVGAKKVEFGDLQDGASHAFCFAKQCYNDDIFVSETHLALAAGENDIGFDPDLRFKATYGFDYLQFFTGVDIVAYVFYDTEHPSDSAIVYVAYVTDPSASIQTSPSKGGVQPPQLTMLPDGRLTLRGPGLTGYPSLTVQLISSNGRMWERRVMLSQQDGYAWDMPHVPHGVVYWRAGFQQRFLGSGVFIRYTGLSEAN